MVRKIQRRKAKEEIIEYLEHRKGKVWMEDVMDDLRIDPVIVVGVLKELHKEGKIK
jgi:hypothetical protein